MRKYLASFFIACCCLLVIASCGKTGAPTGELATVTKYDKRWSQYIAQHSTGLVSRTAPIKIRFLNDVVKDEQLGKPIPGLLTGEPAISGDAVFNNPRELVLVPQAYFPSGSQYQLTLDPAKLPALPQNIGTFEFALAVLPQSLTLNQLYVTPVALAPEQMQVKAELSTADVVDADALEKAVTATLADNAVSLVWSHDSNGLRHRFETAAIARQDAAQVFHLNWDPVLIGAAAGSEKGARDTEIPARDQFSVTSAAVTGGESPHIRVDFSDQLDGKQNLNGLLSLSSGAFTLRRENATLLIFPEKLPHSEVSLTVTAAIRAQSGRTLGSDFSQTVIFESEKPQVKFASTGTVLPDAKTVSIGFEAVNVASVQVTAFRVFENNIGQFLQVNSIDGSAELGRVGRYVWQKTITLPTPELNRWQRHAFDVSDLFARDPHGLYRLTLSINRGNSIYHCSDEDKAVPLPRETLPASEEDQDWRESSSWDYSEEYYYDGDGSSAGTQDRNNPCKDDYYRYGSKVRESRNFIAGNIGLIAKAGSDRSLHFAATNLRTGALAAAAEIKLFNFQNQEIAKATTDSNGLVTINPEAKPFYALAELNGQRGYLKLSDGMALPVSHFDVGGLNVERGVKGSIYGERGVWRPGDTVYLTFVLQDPEHSIPANHPATMELLNPRGQLVYTQTNSSPVGEFYAFALATKDADLTGDWLARLHLGGRSFERRIKIETVMPNRLKVDLSSSDQVLMQGRKPKLKLSSEWLTGASAAGLKAEVSVTLKPQPTRFQRYVDFTFEDPTRQFKTEQQQLFDGKLDDHGLAEFEAEITTENAAAGSLLAEFTSRVTEPGGAFSTGGSALTYQPYQTYIGLKLPKGDAARNMLLTDIAHVAEIASVDAAGNPVDAKAIEFSVYKLEWSWWWEKSGDGLAKFNDAEGHQRLSQQTLSTKKGRAAATFEIKYPQWGRYLVRACDTSVERGHCTAQIVYIDWPGWAGRAQEQTGAAANALTLYADKKHYSVGDTATIHLPPANVGRALISLENGSGILRQQWLELDGKRASFELPIEPAFAPNIYVSVTLLQAHEGKANDRPIRLYGVMPLLVSDPQTHLAPQLKIADEVRPETTMKIVVSEKNSRAMNYTLAVVDEGLLGLTNFRTPQLHDEFYQREALGVRTWDMYDDVIGSYGGELEKLLALGGSDSGINPNANNERKRFPPVVRVLGPFRLEAGASATHDIALPPYVGAVRAMLVAADKAAYGSAEKSVKVRAPLMVQATLPRVLSPDEELRVPVSVFVLDEKIQSVKLSISTDALVSVVDSTQQTLKFERLGDQLGFFRIKVKPNLGKTTLKIKAESGKEIAEQIVHIEIRAPNAPSIEVLHKALAPGERWTTTIQPHGLDGSNQTTLEASALPPLNLNKRLQYLIQYPHGCVEQTTSGAFPQVYLGKLLQLSEAEQKRSQSNVVAGIERLRLFQHSSGSFGYWPGEMTADIWATSYVGHFLTEAQRAGYAVPADMLASWKNYQKARAQSASLNSDESQIDQAYRLYTLALAASPELGAMNRLRESNSLPNLARWQLAASYQLIGLNDVAKELLKKATTAVPAQTAASYQWSYGSQLRDHAVMLDAMAGLNDQFRAQEVATLISSQLNDEHWYSTQSLAWSLASLARFSALSGVAKTFALDVDAASKGLEHIKSEKPYWQQPLSAITDQSAPLTVVNRGDSTLYVNVATRGIPKAGNETAHKDGLDMVIEFVDERGHSINIDQLKQGTDFKARISVRNMLNRELKELALTQIMPSGWEILNSRATSVDASSSAKDGSKSDGESSFDYRDLRDDRVQTYFDLKPNETRNFILQLHAAYPGQYYLPGWNVEAMYEAQYQARAAGRWIQVTD